MINVRRLLPLAILPLAVACSALASACWLRAFPASVIAVPLFGAAILSVLIPQLSTALGVRSLARGALLDAVCWLIFTLTVGLHQPFGFGALFSGLVHGPAQLLTVALPAISPRSLLVAPVTLCWLAGALGGQCVARRWDSVLPYTGWLITFGLSYAATQRALGGSATHIRGRDTLLGALLLLAILLMRVAQSWSAHDGVTPAPAAGSDGSVPADAGTPDGGAPGGRLPLRSALLGVAVTVAVVALAAAVVQTAPFLGARASAQRTAPVQRGNPLTPIAFVANLRPTDPDAAGTPLFTVTLNRRAPAYLPVADLDYYDGDGWSFTRTFAPSGGTVAAEPDASLRAANTITQRYTIDAGALTTVPWMPYLDRPERITGLGIDTAPASGMIVPRAPLRAGTSYQVRSTTSTTTFAALPANAQLASSAPPQDRQVLGALSAQLAQVITPLANAAGTPSGPTVAFLQALLRDLQRNYRLAGPVTATPSNQSRPTSDSRSAARTRTPSGHASSAKRTPSKRTPASGTATPSTPASSAATAGQHLTGGTSFADVAAAVLRDRVATPEQYATLFALIARSVGIPARVVTGFRLGDGGSVNAGTYRVSTAQAWTWVEVPIVGQGWVPLDPSPPHTTGAPEQQQQSAAPSSSAPPSSAAVITQNNAGHAVAKPSSVGTRHARSSTGLLIAAMLITLAVLLALLGLVLAGRRRLRRARRSRDPDPRRRVAGAWQEGIDTLSTHGAGDLRAATGAEIAAAAGRRFGATPYRHASYLAEASNAAIFASVAPTIAEADTAWRVERELARAVRRSVPLRTRLRAALAYRRRDRRQGPAG